MSVTFLPPMRLTGATVLRDGALQDRSVALSGGRITRGPLPEVDLGGYLVLPGMIDLHGIDRGRSRGPEGRLTRAAKDAAAHGVTTAWIRQGWSWEDGPDGCAAAGAMLEAHRSVDLGIDLRVLLAVECHATDTAERLVALARRHGVDQVVFRDTLPELIEMSSTEPRRFAARAARAGRTAEALMGDIRAAHERSREVPRFLCRLGEAFDTLGVLYGSMGDPDAETRERYSMIGARLSIFPATRRVAASANAMGDPVVLSAGDVMAERMPALDLIREGRCTALASARGFASLIGAVRLLVGRGLLDLPRAWSLVSAAPAEIARLPDRGVIAPGRRADLVVIDPVTWQVAATISSGRLAFATGTLARRLAPVLGDTALAAE